VVVIGLSFPPGNFTEGEEGLYCLLPHTTATTTTTSTEEEVSEEGIQIVEFGNIVEEKGVETTT